jgi:hypothetical protein
MNIHTFAPLIITATLLSACIDQQQVEIRGEYLSNEQLQAQLAAKHPDLADTIEPSEDGLLLQGNQQQVAQLLRTAKQLDQIPSRYRLIISQSKPGTISTNANNLSIHISKGHSISLSEHMLSDIPWQGYRDFADHNLLTASLDEQLNLKIGFFNTSQRKNRSFEAQLSMKPDKWMQLYGESAKKGVKTYTTKRNELWVKLTPAY